MVTLYIIKPKLVDEDYRVSVACWYRAYKQKKCHLELGNSSSEIELLE